MSEQWTSTYSTTSTNESNTHSTSYEHEETEFFSSDQTVIDSKFGWKDWKPWEEMDSPQSIIIASLIAVLLCICIGCLCFTCRKCNKPMNKPPSTQPKRQQKKGRSQKKPTQTALNQYQQVETDIDTDAENDPLLVEEDVIVFIYRPKQSNQLRSTSALGDEMSDQKEIELPQLPKTDTDSSSKSSDLYYDPGKTLSPRVLNTPIGNTPYSPGMETASFNGCIRAATLTTRGSAEPRSPPVCQLVQVYSPQAKQMVCLAMPVSNAQHTNEMDNKAPGEHVHLFPTTYASNNGPYNHAYRAVSKHLPTHEDMKDEGESEIKEQENGEGRKVSWNETKVAQWVGSRGEKYQQYVQGFVDHGINGRSLCRYKKDETELLKVFGKVVSDEFHRDKLVTDWIALG
eukprot:179305_1